MTALPPELIGRFRCPVCKHGFASLSEKKHHLREQHPKPKGGKR